MPDGNLKLIETSALLILFDAAAEVPNTYLTNDIGLALPKREREHLQELKLIEVRRQGSKIFIGLSDDGWAKALTMIGATDPPAGSGYRGAVIHRMAGRIHDYLQRSGVPPAEFFAAPEIAEPRPHQIVREPALPRPHEFGRDRGEEQSTSDIQGLVRSAYRSVAALPGERVGLDRIRSELGNLTRDQVDAALIAISQDSDVWLEPESDQKTLTAAARAAAVNIGNQDKHLIRIAP